MERSFRNYQQENSIHNFYKKNHSHQTLSFVQEMHRVNHDFKITMSLWDVISLLDEIEDESDPDTQKKQSVHSLQTAEALRAAFPELDWLHLVGFIHDLGKILLLPPFDLPSWCVVGDTFPVGCSFDPCVVYSDLFEDNEDRNNVLYSSDVGIYSPHCGLDNVLFSYGHDEYLYQMLKHNECLIPDLGMKIIRYHSFYSWHKENAYGHLTNEQDDEVKQWVRRFSECDLYSKGAPTPDPSVIEYYHTLTTKYFPNFNLQW